MGAPFPARTEPRRARAGRFRLGRRRFRRPGTLRVAGWAELPNPVVTRAAVPDPLARQFPTRPSLLGATRPAVVPPPTPARHGSFEVSEPGHDLHTSAGAAPGLATRRLPSPSSEVELKASIRCSPCAGGNGTTAGRVAPSSDGPVRNGRASASGTAATVTTGFGSSAHPAPSPRLRSRKAGGMHGRPGVRARRARCPGRGRRAKPTFHGHVDPIGVAGAVETHGADLTHAVGRVPRNAGPDQAGDASRPVAPAMTAPR